MSTSAPRGRSAVDPRRLTQLLVAGVVVQVAGRALDGVWHANHDEFEGTAQQFEAHWLLWLGVLGTVAVAAVALRSDAPARFGLRLTVVASVLYAAVATWHFIEHANHNDPAVAHVLLAVFQVAIFAAVGVAIVTLHRRASGGREPQRGA
jgi:hypothetical protein